ncbi:hypothetical protein AOB54_01325 [beta proteobacterium MWH-UniP1]
MRLRYLPDFLKMLATSAAVFPAGLVHMALSKPKEPAVAMRDLVGMGVNLDKGGSQADLIDELGVKHVLIRVPLWDIGNITAYLEFASEFKQRNKTVLINILQDREHIENPDLLQKNIRHIFAAFSGISDEFQVGNAINRMKWGFFSVQEYLAFFKTVQAIRDTEFSTYRLIGPAVIDFEYHFTIRALFNQSGVVFDRLSALLYVDRMGSPTNKQYGFFDTDRKMRLLSSLSVLSKKVKTKGAYITEVNWPLKGTAPYAPTSETECVSQEQYQRYMLNYLRIAQQSGVVARVYWHQLVAPGYGLVDHRGGNIKTLDAFYRLKEMLANPAG